MIPARKFDKNFFSSGFYKNYQALLRLWVKPVAKRIRQTLKDKGAAKILDVGCSFGTLLSELQNKYSFKVIGIEPSLYALKKAEPSIKDKIKKGSIQKLPFPKNSFDAVICFDVIYYLKPEEIKKAVKSLVNVSKEYIFFNSLYRHAPEASQKHNPDNLRLTVLSKKEYINLFLQDGAKLIGHFYAPNGGDTLIFRKIVL